jgi:hypothetical protein
MPVNVRVNSAAVSPPHPASALPRRRVPVRSGGMRLAMTLVVALSTALDWLAPGYRAGCGAP